MVLVMTDAPRGITRRTFVRRTVGTATVAAAGGVGFAAFKASAPSVTALPRFPYLGLNVLPNSKSPRGLPLIPVRRREDDVLEGEPRHLEWYRYCSRNMAPGLFDSYSGDDAFRYLLPEARRQAADRLDLWWRNKAGEPMHASDFPGLGDGALVSWRSQGAVDSNLVGALVIKVDPDAYEEPARSDYVAEGFLGAVALCGHFCCTPVYRMGDEGYHAGHWDDVVCDCHGSWYDPAAITEYTFPPTG